MIDLAREREIRDNREVCGIQEKPPRLTLAEAEAMPVIFSGHTDNEIKEYVWEGKRCRVWLSRMTVADGMPYDNQIWVECLATPAPGRPDWLCIDEYEAK
jgi:hypothetical protein